VESNWAGVVHVDRSFTRFSTLLSADHGKRIVGYVKRSKVECEVAQSIVLVSVVTSLPLKVW
jgi:hypothetical protein